MAVGLVGEIVVISERPVVTFRVDASISIGSGHVMRCLTLAEALVAHGAKCFFICREHSGNLIDYIRGRGHGVYSLACSTPRNLEMQSQADHSFVAHADWLGASQHEDAQLCASILNQLQPEWLVVDHYAIDSRWEHVLRPSTKNLIVIDDLADRCHECDVLIDQNLGRNAQDYAALVPRHCQVLAGAGYALLRPEFLALREFSLGRRAAPRLQRILISMGGVDLPNATGRILDALKCCNLPADCQVEIVTGGKSPWLEQWRAQAREMPWPVGVHVDVNDMGRRMAESDLAIGAAGSTSWERCCLGLPAVMVVIAENQRAGANALQASGSVYLIGDPTDIPVEIPRAIAELSQASTLQRMSRLALRIADGRGVERVVKVLANIRKVDLDE